MFGLRAWPTPIVKPLWPFMISGVVTIAGVWKLQDIGVSCEYHQRTIAPPFLSNIQLEETLMRIIFFIAPDALKDPKNPFGTYIFLCKDPNSLGIV
ncbi:F-type H+-transporting ATPase subunit J [Kwoniella mangroviensis CBS 8886]|nr:F-type H+-transporting ATPase subunit J [Kwoniella mangroviensis CBS 8886]